MTAMNNLRGCTLTGHSRARQCQIDEFHPPACGLQAAYQLQIAASSESGFKSKSDKQANQQISSGVNG
jgi:hypothetical protein